MVNWWFEVEWLFEEVVSGVWGLLWYCFEICIIYCGWCVLGLVIVFVGVVMCLDVECVCY